MAGYQGYAGYGDPARAKVDRARQMAELLQQGATDTGPKSFWEGAAQLGKAFIARGANERADQAESTYADNRKRMADTLISTMYPDAKAQTANELAAPAAFDLTPGGMEQRTASGGISDKVKALAGYLGDPMQAIQIGQGMQAQQAAIEERARKEAELVAQARAAGLDPGGVLAMSLNPTEFGKSYSTNYEAANVAGGDSRAVFENGKRTMITAPKPQDPKYFNTGQAVVSVGPDGKPSVLYRDPQQQSGSTARYENISAAEMEALGYPKGTIGQRNIITNQVDVKSRPSTQQTGQPTESERAAGLHATVSINGLRNIMAKEGAGYNRAGGMEQVAGIVGGENERLYDQAADEFIDGYLRAMTGAAATKSEIDTYKRQWFPAFGDSDAVIKQKSAGRLNALKGMKSKAGRAWNPEWDGMIADLEQQAAPAQQNEGPKFPDGTPITQERLQQLNPQMRSIYAAQLAAYEKDNGNDDAFIDSLFPSDPQVQDAGVELPAGVTPEEWDAMTPEEQALFQ